MLAAVQGADRRKAARRASAAALPSRRTPSAPRAAPAPAAPRQAWRAASTLRGPVDAAGSCRRCGAASARRRVRAWRAASARRRVRAWRAASARRRVRAWRAASALRRRVRSAGGMSRPPRCARHGDAPACLATGRRARGRRPSPIRPHQDWRRSGRLGLSRLGLSRGWGRMSWCPCRVRSLLNRLWRSRAGNDRPRKGRCRPGCLRQEH